MSEKQTVNNYGVGWSGLLGVAFVVLKLLGKIDWSCWWVTAPFWMPLAILLVLFLEMIVVLAAKEWFL